MNNKEHYIKVKRGKTINAIKINGKYVDSEYIKAKVARTLSVTTLLGALAAISGIIFF